MVMVQAICGRMIVLFDEKRAGLSGLYLVDLYPKETPWATQLLR